ncbi:MAG TPA: hypothetical protein VGI71_17805 [Scandinavium sp.]|jgi:hypothetical protein
MSENTKLYIASDNFYFENGIKNYTDERGDVEIIGSSFERVICKTDNHATIILNIKDLKMLQEYLKFASFKFKRTIVLIDSLGRNSFFKMGSVFYISKKSDFWFISEILRGRHNSLKNDVLSRKEYQVLRFEHLSKEVACQLLDVSYKVLCAKRSDIKTKLKMIRVNPMAMLEIQYVVCYK